MHTGKIRPLTAIIVALFSHAALAAAEEEKSLAEMVVTGTREGESLKETPATVGVIKQQAIRDTHATHPSQLMGQVPGVWVNVTGGEGHQTAIRQPLTTNPVYLYLEDGIPTRSTGFFNHNALYEVNIPQAGGIEVLKGPGTALYGSDAIGGVVNILTRTPPRKAEAELSAEAGSYGWQRLLGTAGNAYGDDAVRADLNLTHTDGWRDHTGYDRQSATLRWDHALGDDALLKTVATYSNIDQQTAGSSALTGADYRDNPTRNYTPISFRKVTAFRLSSAYERETADSLLSITPYFRHDDMDLLANWSLSYDPTVYNTRNESFGLLAKYRRDFEPMRARLIVGLDIDNSPGRRLEDSITTSTTGSGATKIYQSYATGPRVYDYDVTYRGIAPYVHGELSPTERLRLTAGLRYDNIRYSYDNNLATGVMSTGTSVGTKYYGHAGDTDISYGHLSPKLGATYALTQSTSAFAAYNHAFRAPSENQLFRPSAAGSASAAQVATDTALGLKPVKADNLELGLRGRQANGLAWDVSIYNLRKRDDILSYKPDPTSDQTAAANAGATRHRGIEIGLGAPLGSGFQFNTALSYAKHTYQNWVATVSGANVNYSGNEMAAAPRLIATTRLGWEQAGYKAELEWVKLGSYWLDDANTQKYAGHSVFNLRGRMPVSHDVDVFATLNNVFDKRYAESASISSNQPVFAPGMPRTIYAGVQARW